MPGSEFVLASAPEVEPELASKHNLPAQPTPLIGREKEVAAAQQLLRRADVRLLTLAGPGGVGKTRLGLQVAANLIPDFIDGVYFVSLAPVGDPTLVVSTIAQTLGLREAGDRPLLNRLHQYLRHKQLLLLLDSVEQALPASPLVADLLSACPDLKVLVTSRAVLRLRIEHEFPVPPLALPDRQRLPPIEALSQVEAVALFVERALAVKPDFAVTRENAPAVAEICHCLDGLPLAIELAAARVKLLPPEAMLGRLEHRLQFLTGGAHDLPARQQTLRSTIQWSYDLLGAGEQQLFRRLSVFVGGCTLEATEAVVRSQGSGVGGQESQLRLEGEVLDELASLIDKNLLRQAAQGQGGREPRYGMLETIREFGLEALAASGEEEAIRRRHASFFLALSERIEQKLKRPEQAEWLDQLEQEHDNLRAALEWSQTALGGTQLGLHLVGTLGWFWEVRGHLSEGRRRLAAVLSRPEATEQTVLRARALGWAGRLALFQGDDAAARPLYEQALMIWRELKDKRGISISLVGLGTLALNRGDFAEARTLHEKGLAIRRELGDKWGIAGVLNAFGLALGCAGEHERARAVLEESLALHRELGNKQGSAFALLIAGFVALRQRHYRDSTGLFEESLALFREEKNKQQTAGCLAGLAQVATAQGQLDRAARFFGAAEALYETIGASMWSFNRADYERDLAAVRAQLGEEAFAAAWEEGRTMTPEQVITAQGRPPMLEPVGATPPSAATAEPPPTYPAGLTAREVEVLRLVAMGLSDAQVAEKLVISRRTVHSHLSSIYGKLGVTSRTAAVRFAMDHNLI